MQYVTPKVAAVHFNVTTTTLQSWANEGKIECKTLASGHRRYKIEDEIESKPTKPAGNRTIIYCRVSSFKQRADLVRQIGYMREKYPTYDVITDVGSGLNYKRKGFKRILEQLLLGNIQEVVVAYKDRWCRFGYEHFEWLFTKHSAKLIAVDSDQIKSKQQELTEDLMAIVGIFNARYNGSRKYDNTKGKDLPTDRNEIAISSDV